MKLPGWGRYNTETASALWWNLVIESFNFDPLSIAMSATIFNLNSTPWVHTVTMSSSNDDFQFFFSRWNKFECYWQCVQFATDCLDVEKSLSKWNIETIARHWIIIIVMWQCNRFVVTVECKPFGGKYLLLVHVLQNQSLHSERIV